MVTTGDMVDDVLVRLGDVAEQVWTRAEVTLHLQNAYAFIGTSLRVFWDWVYLENLPPGFSYTQPWERAYLAELGHGFDYGCANFTAEVDRRALGDERDRIGPANHTSPFLATDGWLAAVGASTAIPATADVPKTLTRLARVTWDGRAIDALEVRATQRDSRYETTQGEVYGFLWQQDGVRTVRKVRVPAAQAATATVNGSWGALRRPTDLSTDPVTGTWGLPRRVPGQHPIGAERFGAPRRPFLEGTNVRVEHFRLGRALTDARAVCELPDRYAIYLRDYAQGRLLARPGPGQDLKLAAFFTDRWTRHVARITARLDRLDADRVAVIGGDGRPSVARPPRPQRPWPYGSVVR